MCRLLWIQWNPVLSGRYLGGRLRLHLCVSRRSEWSLQVHRKVSTFFFLYHWALVIQCIYTHTFSGEKKTNKRAKNERDKQARTCINLCVHAVKPVFKDYPRDWLRVDVMDRWSLQAGELYPHKNTQGCFGGGRNVQVDVIARWSQGQVWLLRFGVLCRIQYYRSV